jgi:hypothetical protein
MLSFYYDLLDKYIDRSDFELAAMDTDSNYLALSTETLEAAIKPELREEFYTEMEKWFPSECCSKHKPEYIQTKLSGNEWAPPQCCIDRFKYDRRTPGLFKEEYNGDAIIALCSKTYCVENKTTNKAKFSCKGVGKKPYSNPMDIYRGVLKNKKSALGKNVGFRAAKN